MKYAVALLSLTSTWGGFEFYHKMREAEFLSFDSVVFATASVVCILFGSSLARMAVGE
jgi:hypothetical protein